jgi:hypothetical protein
MKKLQGLRFSAWNGFLHVIFTEINRSTIAIILLAVVFAFSGCSKDQTPANDPFTPHPIISPPSTGAFSATTPDSGYPRTNSATVPAVSGVPAASGVPANGNAGYANSNTMPIGYGNGANPSSGNVVPPPNTLPNGGYPSGMSNTATMTNTGGSSGYNPRAGNNSTLNSLINSTPRPTPTRTGTSNASPAASISGSMATAPVGNRPFDSTQPIRAPSAYDATAPSNAAGSNSPTIVNNTTAPRVPQQGVPSSTLSQPAMTMPMPPTAYGNQNAVPAYLSSIQTIEEANWMPCDGYADEDEE